MLHTSPSTMAIVPARRGNTWNSGNLPRQVQDYIRQGEVTLRQGRRLAEASAPVAKRLLDAFLKQNSGGDAHDVVEKRDRGRAARARPQRARRDMAAIRNMPGAGRGQGWDITDYANMSHGDMLRKTWETNPATSNLMAPRGHGYYDAFANHPAAAMTNMSIGPATPIVAKTRIPQQGADKGIDTGADPLNSRPVPQLLIIGPAASSTQAQLYFKSSALATDLMDSLPFQASALPHQHYPTGPDDYLVDGDLREVIPTRCSVRIRNYTADINRGGIVHVLRMTTGIALGPGVYTTNAELDDLCDAIRDHARTRTYDGSDFGGAGLQKNCVVADQSRSLMFQNFNQCVISGDVSWVPNESLPPTTPAAFPVFPVDFFHYDPTFTPIAVLFEPFINVQPGSGGPAGNTYGITVQSQFLAHYKQGTMLANMTYTPKSDSSRLNAHRDKEEASGSTMQKVMDWVVPIAQTAGALAPMLL